MAFICCVCEMNGQTYLECSYMHELYNCNLEVAVPPCELMILTVVFLCLQVMVQVLGKEEPLLV